MHPLVGLLTLGLGLICGVAHAQMLGYNPNQPSLHGTYVLCQSGAQVDTASATEVNLAVCKIPANTLGANGAVKISVLYQCTSSGNAKNVSVRWTHLSGATSSSTAGDMNILNPANITTSTSYSNIIIARNANSASAQVSQGSNGAIGTVSSAVVAGTIDTTADSYIDINAKVAGGETFSEMGYTVEVMVP